MYGSPREGVKQFMGSTSQNSHFQASENFGVVSNLSKNEEKHIPDLNVPVILNPNLIVPDPQDDRNIEIWNYQYYPPQHSEIPTNVTKYRLEVFKVAEHIGLPYITRRLNSITILWPIQYPETIPIRNISKNGLILMADPINWLHCHTTSSLPIPNPASRGVRVVGEREGRNKAHKYSGGIGSKFPKKEKTLPHFPPMELDCFTIVAVGYSPSVWAPSPNNLHLSLNIQFVIVLGHAPSAESLAAAGYGDY
ncbi:hypothetical protein IW262DRAFT_1297770 [Armillaria fumosa]|nr:hypothetical protein IW262DRAFT_1297770 [Armillaria fumosa]